MAARIIDFVVIDPIQKLVKVPAFMPCVEVWIRVAKALHPFVSDHTSVSDTHQVLPQYRDAVICTYFIRMLITKTWIMDEGLPMLVLTVFGVPWKIWSPRAS
jgi:hypothetical protein